MTAISDARELRFGEPGGCRSGDVPLWARTHASVHAQQELSHRGLAVGEPPAAGAAAG